MPSRNAATLAASDSRVASARYSTTGGAVCAIRRGATRAAVSPASTARRSREGGGSASIMRMSNSWRRSFCVGARRTSPGAHSITWSARSNMAGGTVMPSARAALALTMSLNARGSSIAISAGFSPLRMRAT